MLNVQFDQPATQMDNMYRLYPHPSESPFHQHRIKYAAKVNTHVKFHKSQWNWCFWGKETNKNMFVITYRTRFCKRWLHHPMAGEQCVWEAWKQSLFRFGDTSRVAMTYLMLGCFSSFSLKGVFTLITVVHQYLSYVQLYSRAVVFNWFFFSIQTLDMFYHININKNVLLIKFILITINRIKGFMQKVR